MFFLFSSIIGNTTYFEWSQCLNNSEEKCAQWNQFEDFGTLELKECDMECEIDSFTICESVTGMFLCHQNGTSSVSFNEINITRTNGNYNSLMCTVGWGINAQCFCPPYFKTWFFYVGFNVELNGTIRILRYHLTIIGLLWPRRAQLGHSRSILARRTHKILMVPFNSALKTT